MQDIVQLQLDYQFVHSSTARASAHACQSRLTGNGFNTCLSIKAYRQRLQHTLLKALLQVLVTVCLIIMSPFASSWQVAIPGEYHTLDLMKMYYVST